LKLSQKIGKLSSRQTYDRAARKLRRIVSPISLRSLVSGIDQPRLREIQRRYAAEPRNYAKYAEVERWLKRHIRRVQDLGLNRSPPKTILDLGCGGGFFLYVCKQFGHSVQGLDIDDFALLGELVDLLGVPRITWRIEAFQPLPDLGRKFDWITAFSTRFNRDAGDERVWGTQEWEFLLDDLASRLAQGGKIFLEINSGKTRTYYPDALRDLFRSRGARLERDYVYFANGVQPLA
jgi:SAM-dependent methyltransferase